MTHGSKDPKEQKECHLLLVKKLPERWKELYKSPPLLHGDILLPFIENGVCQYSISLSDTRVLFSVE